MYFGKGTRLTMTAEIINNAKRSKLSPGMYKIKDKCKIKGMAKSNVRKSVWFIDESEFKGSLSTPFYDSKLVERHLMTPDFKRQCNKRKTKIEKDKSIAPNSYNLEESFNKTQINFRKCQFLKGKKFVESEKELKRRLFVPAPGHYSIDKAEQKVYKPFGPRKQ